MGNAITTYSKACKACNDSPWTRKERSKTTNALMIPTTSYACTGIFGPIGVLVGPLLQVAGDYEESCWMYSAAKDKSDQLDEAREQLLIQNEAKNIPQNDLSQEEE